MTRDVYRRFSFDGLTSNGAAPDEYIDHVEPTTNTFDMVLDTATEQFNADTATVGYYDDDRDEWVEMPHWKALVNPAWLGDGLADSPQSTRKAAWSIPTTSYTPVSPDEWWEPLQGALTNRGMDAFGQLRLSRKGGVQVWDVFTPSITIPAGRSGEADKIVGISTGHDYLSGTKLFAEVIVFDPLTQDAGGPTVYRSLSDPRTRKHTGDANSDVIEWWSEVLDQTENAADTLRAVIADAMAYEFDLAALPVDLPGLYTHLGLPETTLAPEMADRSMKTCPGQYDAFHLHRAGTYVLEHDYGGKDSRTFANHMASLNELLFNPQLAEKKILQSLKDDLDDEQTTFNDAGEFEQNRSEREDVVERIETLEDGVDAYESTRERLKTILTDLSADADDGAGEAEA